MSTVKTRSSGAQDDDRGGAFHAEDLREPEVAVSYLRIAYAEAADDRLYPGFIYVFVRAGDNAVEAEPGRMLEVGLDELWHFPQAGFAPGLPEDERYKELMIAGARPT